MSTGCLGDECASACICSLVSITLHQPTGGRLREWVGGLSTGSEDAVSFLKNLESENPVLQLDPDKLKSLYVLIDFQNLMRLT